MKKLIALVAIAAGMTACNNEKKTETTVTVDSTSKMSVDAAPVVTADTTIKMSADTSAKISADTSIKK